MNLVNLVKSVQRFIQSVSLSPALPKNSRVSQVPVFQPHIYAAGSSHHRGVSLRIVRVQSVTNTASSTSTEPVVTNSRAQPVLSTNTVPSVNLVDTPVQRVRPTITTATSSSLQPQQSVTHTPVPEQGPNTRDLRQSISSTGTQQQRLPTTFSKQQQQKQLLRQLLLHNFSTSTLLQLKLKQQQQKQQMVYPEQTSSQSTQNLESLKQLLQAQTPETSRLPPIPQTLPPDALHKQKQNTLELLRLLKKQGTIQHIQQLQQILQKQSPSQQLQPKLLQTTKCAEATKVSETLPIVVTPHSLPVHTASDSGIPSGTGNQKADLHFGIAPPPAYHSVRRVSELQTACDSPKEATVASMTFGFQEGKDRPSVSSGGMDSRFTSCVEISPYINTCADLTHSIDFLDASIYASSPNSLFMYDQEKMDMQSSLCSTSTTCSSARSNPLPDDFELKSQYEISQDLSCSLPHVSKKVVSSMICDSGGGLWEDLNMKPASGEDIMIKEETPDDVSNPTLAELNLDLLDDIETFISDDILNMKHSPSIGTTNASQTMIKQEPANMNYDKDRVVETMQLPAKEAQGHSKKLYTTMRPVVQQLYDPNLPIKTEPADLDMNQGIDGGNYQSFTSMIASAPKPSSEVVQNLPQQLPGTIKALDISDFSTLQRLLQKRTNVSPARVPRKRTVSETVPSSTSQLGVSPRKRSVPPVGLESMDRKWEEIKQFISTEQEKAATGYEPPAAVKRERKRYDSASSAMTWTSNEDEDSDSDRDYDDDSDSDLEGAHDIGSLNSSESLIGGSKEKQFFWQYNVQAKGPKGTRVHFDMEEDPHVLNDFEDPVFDPTNSTLAGSGVSIKHGGKARKGDGNDIVPSPKKLCQIGLQLRRINKQINDFVPVSELPSAARNRTRKEKNKLASRACRLKKKAQHEAHKIKLHGLELEHRQLLTVMALIRRRLMDRLRHMKGDNQPATTTRGDNQLSMVDTLEQLIKGNLDTMIAGNTTEYVNGVIRKVEEGDLTGGVYVQKTRSYPKELHN